MKKTRIIALTLALSVFSLFVSPDQVMADLSSKSAEPLSIEAAIEMAAKNNPGYRQALLQLEKSEIIRDKTSEAVSWIPERGLVDPQYQDLVNKYQQSLIGYDTAKKSLDAQKDILAKDVISAYTGCLKNYNNLNYARINLKDMERQTQISGIARTVGIVNDFEHQNIDTAFKVVKEQVKAQEASYNAAVASLRALLGKDDGWQPELTSRPIISNYARNELETELSRAANESILLLEKKAKYDIEKSKEHWVLPNQNSEIKSIDLELSSAEYEQARRDTKSTVESLYWNINALEGQVEAAQKAYNMAEKELELAQIKYEMGIISEYSLEPSGNALAPAKVGYEKARKDLENYRVDLVQAKANFATLTGQQVYSAEDWSNTSSIQNTDKK